MKTSLNNGVNGEGAEKQPYYEAEVVTDREKLVDKLNGICNQLLQWGLAHNPGDVKRVVFFRAAIYATSVQLQALKDKEIDTLMLEIEKIKQKLGMEIK